MEGLAEVREMGNLKSGGVGSTELTPPSSIELFEGPGVIAMYYDVKVIECPSNLDCYAIAIESPWLEWIPPPSYYSSLLDAKRDFEEKVVLYILAVLLSTANMISRIQAANRSNILRVLNTAVL